MNSKTLKNKVEDYIAIKKSTHYFYLVRNFYELPRHDPSSCILCNPAAAHFKKALDALTVIIEQLTRIEVANRLDTIEFMKDLEGDRDSFSNEKERRAHNYLLKTPGEKLVQDWRKNKSLLRELFIEYVHFEIDNTFDAISSDHTFLNNLLKTKKRKNQYSNLYNRAKVIASDPYLEVERALFEMDRCFDAAPFYPLSIHDQLAMRFAIPGLRGIPLDIQDDLASFVDTTISPYIKSPRTVIIPHLTRMDPAIGDYVEENLLPYIQGRYPAIYKKIFNEERQFLSSLPSVKEGRILTEEDFMEPDATMTTKDVMHLLDQNPVDIIDYTDEDAFDYASDIMDIYLKETGLALAQYADTSQGKGHLIKEELKKALKTEEGSHDNIEDMLLSYLDEYKSEVIGHYLKTDNSFKTFRDDEYLRAYVRLEILPKYPKPLWPWLYREFWKTYVSYVVGDY